MMFLIFWSWLSWGLLLVKCQSLSIPHLSYLRRLEGEKIIPAFQEYSTLLNSRGSIISQFLQDYKQGRKMGRLHLEGNPLATFRMLRSFARTIEPLILSVGKGMEDELRRALSGKDYPGELDLVKSTLSLLRHQHIYSLKCFDLVRGIVSSVHTGVDLTSEQCMEMAMLALDKEYYSMALPWIMAARDNPINPSSSVSSGDIKEALASLVMKHNDNYETKREKEHMFIYTEHLVNNHHTDLRNESYLPSSTTQVEMENVVLRKIWDKRPYSTFALCQGMNLQSLKIRKRLKCWLDSGRHPYFMLQPLRVEKLAPGGPHIFHSFITKSFVSQLKKIAMPSLQNNSQPQRDIINFAYLKDEDPLITKLKRFSELVTGLNVLGPMASQELRIALYASGGGMREHNDAFNDDPSNTIHNDAYYADRLATFLIYLSSIEVGGGTAFPNLGMAVKPTEGSAVYWENLLANGEDLSVKMRHTGCPVLLGTKYYATLWIRMGANIFKRPFPRGY